MKRLLPTVLISLLLASCQEPFPPGEFFPSKLDVSDQFLGFAEASIRYRASAESSVTFESTCHCVKIIEPVGPVKLDAGDEVQIRATLYAPDDSRFRQRIIARVNESTGPSAVCDLVGEMRPLIAFEERDTHEVVRPSSLANHSTRVALRLHREAQLLSLRSNDQRARVLHFERVGDTLAATLELTSLLPDGDSSLALAADVVLGSQKAVVPVTIPCKVISEVRSSTPSVWLGASTSKEGRDIELLVLANRSRKVMVTLDEPLRSNVIVDLRGDDSIRSDRRRFVISVHPKTGGAAGVFGGTLRVLVDGESQGSIRIGGIAR